MKKTYIICILLAVLILAGGTAAFLLTGNSMTQAEDSHRAVYDEYQRLRNHVSGSSVSILENGVIVGSYSLEQLGVLTDTLGAVDAEFSEIDRMTPAAFAELTPREKLQWAEEDHPIPGSISVNPALLDVSVILDDLNRIPRQAPQNAYVDFLDGSFLVHAEVPGNELKLDVVQPALVQALSALTVSSEGPASLRYDVTSEDCYLQPALTAANTHFDFSAMLLDCLQDVTVTVNLHDVTETLQGDQLSQVLTVNSKGKVVVDEEGLRELLHGWAEKHQKQKTPYLMDTYVDGVKPIEWMKVDYYLDYEALSKQLSEELIHLRSFTVDAPWLCWYKDQPFDLGDTYIEVDIDNQVMTYFKNGEVIVSTDVVTGATWGYPTPEGLYDVDNVDTDCWLSGEDYNVHIDYWIGVIGFQIGIHDADWRTIFGGQQYIREGSHGCINTPKEAVIPIFENVELGTPVLIHGK